MEDFEMDYLVVLLTPLLLLNATSRLVQMMFNREIRRDNYLIAGVVIGIIHAILVVALTMIYLNFSFEFWILLLIAISVGAALTQSIFDFNKEYNFSTSALIVLVVNIALIIGIYIYGVYL